MIKRAGIPQSPRDRVLWVLVSCGGRMERGKLMARARIRYVLLDPILAELVKEGRIGIDASDVVSLM